MKESTQEFGKIRIIFSKELFNLICREQAMDDKPPTIHEDGDICKNKLQPTATATSTTTTSKPLSTDSTASILVESTSVVHVTSRLPTQTENIVTDDVIVVEETTTTSDSSQLMCLTSSPQSNLTLSGMFLYCIIDVFYKEILVCALYE